jgi:hypothetical protein
MKIKFISPSPKAGTVEHVENVAGRALVIAGFAEECKPANYRERLAQEQERINATAPPPQPVLWGIREALCNDPYSPRFVITKTSATETLHFSTLPSDAPPGIKQRWADLHATDAQLYKDRQEFLKRKESEPRTTTGFNEGDLARVVVIGGKK